MANNKFADLHCHPASRPLNNQTGSMWEGYCYGDTSQSKRKRAKKLRQVLRKQLRGDRGIMYDQASYPKLLNGNVKLVFASIYPLEKGFLQKKSYRALDPNATNSPWVTVSEDRDFLLKGFTKYPVSRLKELRKTNYWEQFIEEYNSYFLASSNNDNEAAPLGAGSEEEIKALISDPDFGLTDKIEYKSKGQYTILDGATFSGVDYDTDTVYTVLTLEGIGVVTQDCFDDSCYPLKVRDEADIIESLTIIKQKTPVFFITFCHHFDNGVCGHARSFIRLTKLVKLNQSDLLDDGFTDMGRRLLHFLLSVKIDATGEVQDEPKHGRRIFIDMKHMSYKGRVEVIQLVRQYNASHPDNKIPLISSHTAFTGSSEIELQKRIKFGSNTKNTEMSPTQSKRVDNDDLDMEIRYNTWSINLCAEEIKDIVESDGLIGLSFEQNILGIAFIGGKKGFKIKGKKNLKSKIAALRNKYARLMVGQLCTMAEAAGSESFWKCICIGTDFDGLINPIDGFSSALCFELVRSELIKELEKLNLDTRETYFLTGDASDIEEVVDGFCFNNAANFVQRHFIPNMPVSAVL